MNPTPEQLRQWAEAAGLEVYEQPGWGDSRKDSFIVVFDDLNRVWRYGNTNPALLPLIAERLVKRVRETGREGEYTTALIPQVTGLSWTAWLETATAAQRAAAAYSVLEDTK